MFDTTKFATTHYDMCPVWCEGHEMVNHLEHYGKVDFRHVCRRGDFQLSLSASISDDYIERGEWIEGSSDLDYCPTGKGDVLTADGNPVNRRKAAVPAFAEFADRTQYLPKNFRIEF